MTFILRDYQADAVNTGVSFFEQKRKKSEIAVLPTGAGKSLVIGSIADNVPGKTLVLQPSKEILEQNLKKTMAFGQKDIGVYSASFGMKKIRKITFATIGSIVKKPELFENIDNIIMDECDLTNAKGGMYANFFDELGKPVLGLTATPYRLHPPTTFNNSVIKFIHRTRPRVFSELSHITQNRILFDRQYLAKIEYVKEDFDNNQLTYNTTGAEFSDFSMKKYAEESGLIGRIAKHVKEATARHILIFVNFISEAEALERRLSAIGMEAKIVTGETHSTERAKILADFKSGRLRIVINVGVLTVGFDFPQLDLVINGRITNSVRLYYQILGRLIRIHEEKLFGHYIDLGGNVQRFGKIEDFEICGPKGAERLKSGDKFLTGVDMKTGRDLEAERAQEKAAAGTSDAIPFGKHKGQKFTHLPASYLSWLAENFSPGTIKQKAVEELSRRAQGGIREGASLHG